MSASMHRALLSLLALVLVLCVPARAEAHMREAEDSRQGLAHAEAREVQDSRQGQNAVFVICTYRLTLGSPRVASGSPRLECRLASESCHWTSKDSSRFAGGLNFYGYANNDPVNYVDVDGHNPLIAALVVVIGMGLSAPSDTSAAPADIVGMMASVPGPSVVGMLAEQLAERLPGFARLLNEVLRDSRGAIRLGPRWKPLSLSDPNARATCEQAAEQISKHLGEGARTVRITPRDSPFLGGFKDANFRWGHHEVVVKNGRVYDAFTGHGGMPISDYKALWDHPDAIDFGF